MPEKEHYKVVIIGSGPAGLTAGIYASRANLAPLLIDGAIEGSQLGGQLTTTTDVENFPGFPDGIQGPELIEVTRRQAARFGTEIVYDTVTAVDLKAHPFPLALDSGATITADSLIIATGASAKYLGIPTEKTFMGHGVSACATCDGYFHRGKDVVVVGGGDTAMEESTYLAKLCRKVYLVHRRNEFRASKIMQQRALATPNIEVLWATQVVEIVGEGHGEGRPKVTGVVVEAVESGERRHLPVSGYFAAIGHKPNTDLFKGVLEMNEVGYLKIDHPTTRTSVPGVFAAGDVADFMYRQAVSAAGEGCKAALDAERWLAVHGVH